MTSSSYNHTAFPDDSEFLDSEPLHLSGGSAGLDAFDFILDDDDELNHDEIDGGAERLFADSSGSDDFDALLDDSEESESMDFQFETLESSLDKMGFGAIEESDETMRSSGNSQGYRPSSCRRNQLQRNGPPSPHGRFQMSAVNFDPPAAPQQRQQRPSHSLTQSMPPRRVSGFAGPRRQTSESDLSVCSYSTAQSSLPNPVPSLRRLSVDTQLNETTYDDALRNLAESMKRTEATRRHVMMQRNMLTPAQQAALISAKEQLQVRNQHVQHQATHQNQQSMAPVPAPQTHDMHQEGSQRSSIMAAFFSGSRDTLTNGLEQSRKQLSMYMGQMNNQTF